MGEVNCPFCRGEMQIIEHHRHNKGVAATTIFLGILSFFTLNILLGALLLIIGLFMAFSKKEFWHCLSCSSAIERLKKEPV